MKLVLALLVVFGLLVCSEALWRAKRLRGENARKLVHILVGTFVAFWPFFLSWNQIRLASLGFLVVVAASQRYRVFHAVHNVRRRTGGEVFFALSIGLLALLAPARIIFTAAILHLSLADGMAAVVGISFGLKHHYKVAGYTKTILGSLTFYVVSTTIVVVTILLSSAGWSWGLLPLAVGLPIGATILENLGVAGIDNILVPLLVVLALQAAHLT